MLMDVYSYGSLANLAVSDDDFTLTASNRYHSINATAV